MKFDQPEPQAREAKPAWTEIPTPLLNDIENCAGEKIADAEIAWGGYSPSASYKAVGKSGRTYFIKGTHPEQTAHGAQMMRQEIWAYENIPYLKEISPAYYGSAAHGSEDDWLIGIWEYFDDAVGCVPWTAEKLEKVLSVLSEMQQENRHLMADAKLLHARETNFLDVFFAGDKFWTRLENPDVRAQFLTLFQEEAEAELWLQQVLPVFIGYETKMPHLSGVESLLHFDLRSDNIVFDRNGNVRILDWPNISKGPVIMDIAGFLPSVAGEGGLPCDQAMAVYLQNSGFIIDTEEQATALASIAGYFATNAYRAVPEKLPRLRWIQKLQLYACLHWAHLLIKTPLPPVFRRDDSR